MIEPARPAEQITVTLLLFAQLRELAGARQTTIALRRGATTAHALDHLRGRPAMRELLARLPVVTAVNGEYAALGHALRDGDTVAVVPPVSGGAPIHHVRVTEERLSIARLTALVTTPGTGAVVSFQGVTRDVEYLDFEAYVEMAEPRIATILAELDREHRLEGIAAEHRVGSVPRGEPSVIIAAAARHRGPAFAAAAAAIDRIKAETPIWKREIDNGKARWVAGTAPVVSRATAR